MRAPLRSAGVVVLVAVLAGCGQTVDEGDLTDQVSAAVEEASGSAPDGVDCPEALDAEEGATTTCEVTVGDESYDVGVEVTGVDGDTAEFDVDVPEDLVGEQGATTTCTLEADGEEYDVAIEVTGVEGANVNFSIQVADQPNP